MAKRKYTSLLRNFIDTHIQVVTLHMIQHGPDSFPMCYQGILRSFDDEFILMENQAGGLCAVLRTDVIAVENVRDLPPPPSDDDSYNNVFPLAPA